MTRFSISRSHIFGVLAAVLSLFILAEVNYPQLTPQSELAFFAMLGLVLIFLSYPLHPKVADRAIVRTLDFVLVAATLLCFGYILMQSEPIFRAFWIDGQPLGNRAGAERSIDHLVGIIGLVLVLEGTRRSLGWALPLLSIAFLLYAVFGQAMLDWLFPHRGYGWQRIVGQTFLHSQGVFGIALNVMFTYVYLFILFGTVLERTGATDYIIDLAQRLFWHSTGGSAKVAVISSGLMGSLSGSAVANTATTGTFTIPMMRSAGFGRNIAGAIEAAASSGGALVPPIMGAGAYMMLEIVNPPVTYLQIISAAIIPALLYYAALLFIVHFHARRVGAVEAETEKQPPSTEEKMHGIVFVIAFVSLIGFLLIGYTPFRAVSLSLLLVIAVAAWKKETRVGLRGFFEAMRQAARGGVPLVVAASCVGIILGVVTLTGAGTKLPAVLLPLAEHNLLLALLLMMVSTIILGMGLPSAVCYLLMATLIGPMLADLGIVPLAAHFFIFYFGMMSMVTPPVALAAYAAAAISGGGVMQTAWAAFRFSLVGFALPFAFVLQPELLFLAPDGSAAGIGLVLTSALVTFLGLPPLAAALVGHWFAPVNWWHRLLLFAASSVLFMTPVTGLQKWLHFGALALVIVLGYVNWRAAQGPSHPQSAS